MGNRWFTTYGANPCKALAELAAAAVASGVGKRKAVAVAPAGGNTAAVRAARPLCMATPRRAAPFVCVCFFARNECAREFSNFVSIFKIITTDQSVAV